MVIFCIWGYAPHGAAKEHGVITSFDVLAVATPNLMEVVNICLPYVDFFIPNYEETVMICGLRGRQEIVRYFLDRGAKHTVLRMGANGSAIGTPEGEVRGRFEPQRLTFQSLILPAAGMPIMPD